MQVKQTISNIGQKIKNSSGKQKAVGIGTAVLIVGGTIGGLGASGALAPSEPCTAPHNVGAGSAQVQLISSRQIACQGQATTPSGCVFANGAQAAFCDTFDTPQPSGGNSRSGDLSDVIWGASRVQNFNTGQQQFDNWPSPLLMTGSCAPQRGTSTGADNDIKICNGQLNEAVDDNLDINASNTNSSGASFPYSACPGENAGGNPVTLSNGNAKSIPTPEVSCDSGDGTVSALTMYPKQPFDFAGRVGRIVFDVSADSGGTHAAWPEFWVTDKPVPNPFIHFNSWQSIPQYGFGIRLDQACSPLSNIPGDGSGGSQCGSDPATCNNSNTGFVTSVASAVTINNYFVHDGDTLDSLPAGVGDNNITTNHLGCVKEPTLAQVTAGYVNHFEIDISADQKVMDVYGTDAFAGPLDLTKTPLIHLANIPNANLGFTKGLVWPEDVHYNGNKGTNPYTLQGMHTFVWDNIGFDGPALARDLTFDVPDALTHVPNYPNSVNLGYFGGFNSGTGKSSVTLPPVIGITAANIAAASGCIILTNMFPLNAPTNISYSLNGHATNSYAWPFLDGLPSGFPSSRTFAIPISCADLNGGSNNVITLNDTDPGGIIVYNTDILLVAAGGPGGVIGGSTTTTTAPSTTTTAPSGTTTTLPAGGPFVGISPAQVNNNFNAHAGGNYGFNTIVSDPTNGSVLFAGTDQQGIYKSTNAGASWTKIDTGTGAAQLDAGTQFALEIDPFNHNVLWTVSGHANGGPWKSTDGGVNWVLMPDTASPTRFNDVDSIALDPTTANHILLAWHSAWSTDGVNSGVSESKDGGVTWTNFAGPAGSNWGTEDAVWFLGNSITWLTGTQNGYWRTTNSGTSWTQVLNSGGGSSGHSLQVIAGNYYLAHGNNVFTSTAANAGATWTDISTGLPGGPFQTVVNDATNLFTAPAFAASPAIPPAAGQDQFGSGQWYTRPIAGGNWTTFTPPNACFTDAFGNPQMCNGPTDAAYDPTSHTGFSANWLGGLWKVP